MRGSSEASKAEHKAWQEDIFLHAQAYSMMEVYDPGIGTKTWWLLGKLATAGAMQYRFCLKLDGQNIEKIFQSFPRLAFRLLTRDDFLLDSFQIVVAPPFEKEE